MNIQPTHSIPSDLFYDARYSHTKMTNPDFLLLARAMGVHAIRCSNAEELPAKMKEFLEYNGSKPVLMECLVERNEHVFPMVRGLFTHSDHY
jgi:acetolactate synthase-1/2/3 large subunit